MTADVPDLHTLVPLPHVWDAMERVESGLYEHTRSNWDHLTTIAQHLLAAGGKRLRPLLSLLAGEFGTAGPDGPIAAGIAVELIHVGSLYHDDVIDEADTRRGATSANANWDNTVAILAGDFLMARASEVAATRLDQEAVRLLAATYAELVEGQTRELTMIGDLHHGIGDYEATIGGKTASLIRTSARLGARAGGADPGIVDALTEWAWEIGMVFQMADDALDLIGMADMLGKPAGSDIKEGTFTMPVLLASRGPHGDRIRALLEGKPPYDPAAVAEVISLVRTGGYVDHTLISAMERLDRAHTLLDGLADIPARRALRELGGYILARVRAVTAA